MPHDDAPVFAEEQRFRAWWITTIVVLAAIVGWGQLAAITSDEVGPGTAVLLLGVWIAIGVLLPLGWWFVRLAAVVDATEVRVRFAPVQRRGRVIARHDILTAEAITYRALRDWGGWGLRMRSRGRAYTVSGDEGVRIDLVDGTHVLIGSRRSADLAAALQA